MDTKKLRQKILDLAIHGKLVPQDPNDEPASVLLERIRAEKERLVKEGKIKKSKASKTSDTPHYENVPFEIPNSWCWAIGEEIFSPMQSTRPMGISFKYIDIDAIDNTKCKIQQVKTLETKDAPSRATRYTEIGDVLFSMVRPYLRNIAKVTESDCIASTGFFVCSTNGSIVADYCYYLMISDYVVNGLNQFMKGDNSPSINNKHIATWLYPIPPLAEQERIVEGIEKWFALIDQIEQGKVDLQTAIKQTKSKILDLAIHGKLVPQDPNEEPASELLKRINPKAETTCDNGQYGKISKGWCLCRLGDIGKIVTGNTPTKDIAEYYGGNIPFYKPADLEEGKCIKNASDHLSVLGFEQARKIPANSILVTCIGATIGKTGLITVEGSCNQQINAIIPNEVAYAEFIYYTCISDYMQKEIKSNASATTLPILNKGNFAKLPFPLPPYNEQQRIVNKIEELFTSLDNIQKALEV